MRIFKEKAGVISENEVWVCIHEEYLYPADSLRELVSVLNNEWESDKHFVGEITRDCVPNETQNKDANQDLISACLSCDIFDSCDYLNSYESDGCEMLKMYSEVVKKCVFGEK